jgi:hypothetical protein
MILVQDRVISEYPEKVMLMHTLLKRKDINIYKSKLNFRAAMWKESSSTLPFSQWIAEFKNNFKDKHHIFREDSLTLAQEAELNIYIAKNINKRK